MNFRMIPTFVFAGIVLLQGLLAQAAIIYHIEDDPSLQEGHSLVGTITTVDTAPDDNFLVGPEILAWEFTIAGPVVNATASSTDSGTPPSFNIFGELGITADRIFLMLPTSIGNNGFQVGSSVASVNVFLVNNGSGNTFFDYFAESPGPAAWNSSIGPAPDFPTGLDIALTGVPVVPEPSTVILFGLGIVGLGGQQWRKRRKTPLRR